ncbi:hypothetical protein [Pseudalkalibacillus hwajinpoensis]|uniref:Uncharacterized protein n=1 Tax=Guptibacillus hwajinpoensis TaxID=208199 RepID=A0A4U1MN79_9BACL|nr:hypothetical protein [Pseudalkalibacillus hwajinpoensis]TKD72211.1 hypothetical protein FBF83_05290 [Pseudalkalibacillus hwajinpoensis]
MRQQQDLSNFYENLKYERRNHNGKPYQWVILGIYIALMMFNNHFWCYVLWWAMTFIGLVAIGFVAILKKKLYLKQPFYHLKAFLVRVSLVGVSVGGVVLFTQIGVLNYFLDIPHYLKENHEIVKGRAGIHTSSTRGYISQYLTIQGERLENRQILDDEAFEGKVLEVHYLPESKYVVEIWYWD